MLLMFSMLQAPYYDQIPMMGLVTISTDLHVSEILDPKYKVQ